MITTQLGGDILKPQFMEQLNYLKDKSKSLLEKEKCDHLAACLLISSKFSGSNNKPTGAIGRSPQRPKTAMAFLGGNIWDPYETTMNRDYPHNVCSPPVAIRPKTSKSYRNPYYLCDPIGISMYSDEFCWKPHSKPEPIRAATASGARNHRPHPEKTFSVWKLPHQEKKISQDSHSPWIKPPTIEEVQRAMRSQYLSTYKGDYLGTPQGYQIKYAIDTSPNWRKDVPQPLATESRFNYQVQPRCPKLDDFTHKYGCYANRHLSATGVVPSVTYSHIRNQENKMQLTTYQRHFGKRFLDLSALAHSLNPEEVASYLQNVPNEVNVSSKEKRDDMEENQIIKTDDKETELVTDSFGEQEILQEYQQIHDLIHGIEDLYIQYYGGQDGDKPNEVQGKLKSKVGDDCCIKMEKE